MGIIEDVQKFMMGFGGGMVLIGSGVMLSMTTQYIENKDLKLVPQVGGLALALFGGYRMYQTVANPIEDAKEDEQYGITISHPAGSDRVVHTLSFDFTAVVSNPYDVRKRVYVGMTIQNMETGEITDFPATMETINPNSTVDVVHNYAVPGSKDFEQFAIRASVWNKSPTEETEGLKRVGDTGWLKFKVEAFFAVEIQQTITADMLY